MMKKTLFLFAAIFVQQISAQGISFQEAPFKDLLAKAKKENKIIFVDAFASWCGPCKLMEKNVFPTENVSSFYNGNFINAHFDMEKGEGRELAQKYQVRSYPTFLYITGDGELVYKGLGYMSGEDFVAMGKEVHNQFNNKGSIKSQFEKGETNPEFLRNAVKMYANSDSDFAKKVSERYFKIKKDKAFTQEEVSMLLYFLKSVKDPNYQIFVNSKPEIIKVVPENLYNQFDTQLKLSAALENAINSSTQTIDAEAFMKEAVNSVPKEEAEQTLARYQLNYYSTLGNFAEYEKTALKFYKNGEGFAPEELLAPAYFFAENVTNPASLKTAVVWAEKSVMSNETAENTFVLAKLYQKTGNKSAAKTYAQTAMNLAAKNGQDASVVQKFLDEIK